MKILLLGAPGAGKGTQAKKIKEKFNIPIISMGDMLREIIKTDEEMKKKVEPYMESGKLVPDQVVGEILKKRLEKKDCEKGFVLDGFPRNLSQAKLLEKTGVVVDKVIEICVSDDEIINRLEGRIICGECGEIFHMKNKKPKVDGECDVCGGKLKTRKDDEKSTIVERLKVFHIETEPLQDYYLKKGIFFKIDGEKPQEEVMENLLREIEEN